MSFVAFLFGSEISRKESARGGKQIQDEPKTFALIFEDISALVLECRKWPLLAFRLHLR